MKNISQKIKNKSGIMTAFWNGSVMAQLPIKKGMYNELKSMMKKDYVLDEDIQQTKEMLDYTEEKLYQQFLKQGKCYIPMKDQVHYLLCINSLVQKGVVENNDKYGLLTFFHNR
jgi:hypothetical protein